MVQGLLVESVQNGNLSRALQLIADGVDVNETDRFYLWTSLHLAARDGKVGLAKVLLKHKANIDARDSVGQTPLHRAAFWGQLEVCKVLLENGADFTVMDGMMQTPEELARMNGHQQCASLIVQSLVFLEFGGLQHYSHAQVAVMKKQLKEKEREEKRRREVREELEKHGEVADKVREKFKAKEIKIMEKQEALLHKIELVKDEINQLTLSSASTTSDVTLQPISASVSSVSSVSLSLSLSLNSADQLDTSVDSLQQQQRRRVTQHLSKKEVSQMKQLQGKLHKLQLSLDELSLKLNKTRRRSLQNVHVEDKGTAWLAYINSSS